MADIRGVGKPITYRDDNPISEWIEDFRSKRNSQKREPKDAAERELLGRWLAYRGRGELKTIVGTACYAYSHFDMDYEWSPYSDERTTKHFCMDAQDDEAAQYEAEYVLNMDIVKAVGAAGKLWRVDGPQDVFVADVGPLDFGSVS